MYEGIDGVIANMNVKGEHEDIQSTGADHPQWHYVNHATVTVHIHIVGLWPRVGLHAITHTEGESR